MDTTYILSIDAPSLTTLVETELPDNTEGLITPQSLRTVFNCVIDTIDQNHNIEKIETNNFTLNLPSSIIENSDSSINLGYGVCYNSVIADSTQSFVSGVDNNICGYWLGSIEMGRENTLSGTGSAYYSVNSHIKDSWFSTLSESYGSQLLNSRWSCITNSGYSTIKDGYYSCITGSYGSFVQGASSNIVCGSDGFISGGYCNNIIFQNSLQQNSSIINSTASVICGGNNHIYGSYCACINETGQTSLQKNTIIGSSWSLINLSKNSSVIDSTLSCVTLSSDDSNILGGCQNSIRNCSCLSNIIGNNNTIINNGNCSNIIGRLNVIDNSVRSGIIGSSNNVCGLCDSFVVGSNISATRNCSTFVNNLNIMSIPTSSAGLPSKSVWFDATTCTLKMVP